MGSARTTILTRRVAKARQTSVITPRKPDTIRVAIADDSKLIYSDDYRAGWINGFVGIGCEVKTFDIGHLRRHAPLRSVYSARGQSQGKMTAMNIAAWQPDLVWCHHGRAASMDGGFLDQLRKSGIKSAVYLCDEPYESGETAEYSPDFDAAFSMDLCTVSIHNKSMGRHAAYYLPPAVDTATFEYRPYFVNDCLARDRKAFFLGNADLIPRRDWLEPLERVVTAADIRFFPHRQQRGRPVAKGHPRWVDAKDHPRLYSSCMVGLNVHRSPVITQECFNTRVKRRSARGQPKGYTLCKEMPEQEGTGFWNDGNLPASHVNPRFFEMAACGTLVVSDDYRSEMRRMFPFAPRAQDPAHFIELVLYYLDHPEEAEEIGYACSSLISKRHTYQHRACEVLIRLGFKELLAADQHSYLGEPQDWLSQQDSNALEIRLSSEQTGRYERWNPQSGMSLMQAFGKPNAASSLDVPPNW